MPIRFMQLWFLGIALGACAGGHPGSSAQKASLSVTEIAAAASKGTVTILAIDARGDTISQGSGFVVDSNGVVVTNWHVLEGAANAIG
jgi:S1-C subfamily serine protease